jgi:two-component system sensor histidine kinase PilS (NtrC family)
MLIPDEQNHFTSELMTRKIRRLIFGRLALIFLLLLASWWWSNNFLDLSFKSFPNSVFMLFATLIGLTILYLLVLRFNQNYFRQVCGQFLTDVFLVTWIVWETGDVVSPYVTLYIVLITVVGFFFGRLGTVLIALLCAVCFTTLAILSAQSFIYSFSGDVSPSKFVQNLAFNNVGILVVGLLAAYISERRRVGERLKETEESFADLHVLHERILESIRSGLITTDLGGIIQSFNRAAQDISGFRVGEVFGQSVFSIFGEEIRPSVYACINNALEGNTFPTEHFEAVIKVERDEENAARKVTVACSVSPLIGKNGLIYGLIFTFQDISEIRAMEETLRRSDRLAAVGRMAAGLAHEIRNPLGSMSSALQFLQEKVPPETPEGDLTEVVLRESDRLNKIITNFLAYARPSANVFSKEKFELTDVNAAMRDCLVLLRHSPEIKDTHRVDSELPESPVMIKANETQIKQVFWNILRNSVEAMPDGGNLRVRLNEIPERNIQITFEDTGRGISKENLEHLFEPFSSGGGSNGTGLGLSIVRKIVQDHGGHIEIQSRENIGTKVIVEFPH